MKPINRLSEQIIGGQDAGQRSRQRIGNNRWSGVSICVHLRLKLLACLVGPGPLSQDQ